MSTPELISVEDIGRLRAAVEARRAEMVAFAQKLIQTPSLSGEEDQIAAVVRSTLESLPIDDVWVDRTGNVIGAIRGDGGRSMHFNTHLDHVSAGDPGLWAIPPFEGVIRDGILYGRAASDVKGAMAAQVYSLAALRDLGLRPPGDVLFAGVVLEEVGGFGSQQLARDSKTDIAVIGEASGNQLRRGHRGRAFAKVSFRGLSAHASAPERARNPHYAVARFLLGLEKLTPRSSATFGGSSASPTLIATDQTSGNVTPGVVDLFIDWRNVPGESAAEIEATLGDLARMAVTESAEINASIEIVPRHVRTYTGLEATMPSTMGYELPLEADVVQRAKSALERAFARPVEVGVWTFATDGGHLAAAGIECLGFAPGEERHAHTIHDQVRLSDLEEAAVGNAVLAMTLGKSEAVESQ